MDDSLNLSENGNTHNYIGKTRVSPTTVRWFGVSPRADLAGRPTLEISNDQTNAGIARSTMALKIPVYNSDKKAYDSFVRVSATATQPASEPVATRGALLQMLGDVITTFGDEIVAGSV
jgi:hypothetical protein